MYTELVKQEVVSQRNSFGSRLWPATYPRDPQIRSSWSSEKPTWWFIWLNNISPPLEKCVDYIYSLMNYCRSQIGLRQGHGQFHVFANGDFLRVEKPPNSSKDFHDYLMKLGEDTISVISTSPILSNFMGPDPSFAALTIPWASPSLKSLSNLVWLDEPYVIPKSAAFHHLIIPTSGSVCRSSFRWTYKKGKNHHKLNRNFFDEVYKNFCTLCGLSSQTKANQIQRMIEAKVNTGKYKGVLGQRIGRSTWLSSSKTWTCPPKTGLEPSLLF